MQKYVPNNCTWEYSNENSFGVQNEWAYVKLPAPHSFYIQILWVLVHIYPVMKFHSTLSVVSLSKLFDMPCQATTSMFAYACTHKIVQPDDYVNTIPSIEVAGSNCTIFDKIQ